MTQLTVGDVLQNALPDPKSYYLGRALEALINFGNDGNAQHIRTAQHYIARLEGIVNKQSATAPDDGQIVFR